MPDMQNGRNWFAEFFVRFVAEPFRNAGWSDYLDILLLTALLFALYRFAKTRRAGRVLAGLIIVIFVSILAVFLRLPALSYIVQLFASAFFFCLIVIFQPEIRDALERIGNFRLAPPWSDTLPHRLYPLAEQTTKEILNAVYQMSDQCVGALIVLEGKTKLGDYSESGKPVDARVTSSLLCNLFFDKAPLHDGAVILRNFRIYAANVTLPSTTKSAINFGNMGMRHRAAVGVSEVSDALVVVVSEQTGTVSVAFDGRLNTGVDREEMEDILMTFFAGKHYLKTRQAHSQKLYLKRLERMTAPPVRTSVPDPQTTEPEQGPANETGNEPENEPENAPVKEPETQPEETVPPIAPQEKPTDGSPADQGEKSS